MILAFMSIQGSAHPRLCIAADRPDQFSVPVPVEILVETDAAVFRLGPAECITVRAEPRESAVIIAPLARLTGKCKATGAQPQSETQRQSGGERSAGLLGWLRSLFR